MSQQLKRWESPRRQGRNVKGRGGTARQRQLAKRQQQLRQRLKSGPADAGSAGADTGADKGAKNRGDGSVSPSFWLSAAAAAR